MLLSLSMPLTMYESGESQYGVSPASGAAVGDPRIGARVRLFGQPYQGPASLSLGVDVWIPINTFASPPPFPAQTGKVVRALPKLIAGGLWKSLMWSLTAGLLLATKCVAVEAATDELELDRCRRSLVRRWLMPIAAWDLRSVRKSWFRRWSLPIQPVDRGRLSRTRWESSCCSARTTAWPRRCKFLGGGTTFFQVPGAPDFRFLTWLAYAPFRDAKAPDADGDGILITRMPVPAKPASRSKDPKKARLSAAQRSRSRWRDRSR